MKIQQVTPACFQSAWALKTSLPGGMSSSQVIVSCTSTDSVPNQHPRQNQVIHKFLERPKEIFAVYFRKSRRNVVVYGPIFETCRKEKIPSYGTNS